MLAPEPSSRLPPLRHAAAAACCLAPPMSQPGGCPRPVEPQAPPLPLQGFSDSWYKDYKTQPTHTLATNQFGKPYKAIVMPR
jgi:hypothetical protein